MKTTSLLAALLALASNLIAGDPGTLIFQDDFERNESQELKDEIGNGWGTNSKTRAGGHKQVDLKDGAMHITMHPTADHAVSVTHPAEFRDGSVQLRFLLEKPQDSLGLDFADLQHKAVHAGHLFKVTLNPRQVQIDDMRTGSMNMEYYEAKKAKTLSKEQQKIIASAKRNFPTKIQAGQWHDLWVHVEGETVRVEVDGQEAGSFTSPGFGHPTKKMLRLAVPKSAVVDDVRIWRRK